jgi:ABC-type dipeptide/oligopeptide/nickel transport system permease component
MVATLVGLPIGVLTGARPRSLLSAIVTPISIALVARDVLLVTGCALFGAICLAAGNLAADVARAIVDPRVRQP